MSPEQRIAGDYSTRQDMQPRWGFGLIRNVISHLTPIFEETRPERAYAGITRDSEYDYMHVMVFSTEWNEARNQALFGSIDSWMTPEREARREEFWLQSFELDVAAENPSSPDWPKLLTDFGNRGTRYTQIYPPLLGD